MPQSEIENKNKQTDSATVESSGFTYDQMFGSGIGYDTYFEKEESGQLNNPFNLNSEYEIVGNFQDSMYLDEWDDPTDPDLNEKLSELQPWSHKFGLGFVRAGAKALTEIAKMPGIVAGTIAGIAGEIVDSENNSFIETAFNNPWVKAINNLDENIKGELPVYVSKAVSEGNLWDNLSSIDFWATDGADGIGFIAAMLAPGAGISALNVGGKVAGTMAKSTSKVFGANARAAKTLTALQAAPKKANVIAATIANTYFEAGVEAQASMDAFKHNPAYKELQEQIPQRTEEIYKDLVADYKANGYALEPQIDAEGNQLPSRIPTEAEILEELRAKAGQRAQKEVDDKVAEIGRDVFVSNVGILSFPNFVMSKVLWGKGAKRFNIKKKDGAFQALKTFGAKDNIKLMGNQFLKAGAREGFLEEGLQSTTETYFTEDAGRSKSNLGESFMDYIGELPKAYADMLGTLEGQKAIALGMAFGGGMQAFHSVKEDKISRKNANLLINGANEVMKATDAMLFQDYKVNREGVAQFDGNNKPVRDIPKVAKTLQGLQAQEDIATLYDKAQEEGDVAMIDFIQEIQTTQLIKPFITNDILGIDALKDYLESNKNLLELDKAEEIDKDKFIKDTIDKAKQLKSEYEAYDSFAPYFFNIKNTEATKQDKLEFFNRASLENLNYKSLANFYKAEQKKTKELLDKILMPAEDDLDVISKNADKAYKAAKKYVDKAAPIQEQYDALTNLVEEAESLSDNLWDETFLNKKFNKEFVNIAKQRKIEKDVAEIQEVLDKVIEAQTIEELDKITIPDNNVGKDSLIDAINKKKAELTDSSNKKNKAKKKVSKDKKDEQDAEAVERAEAAEFIKNNFNEGEVISLPDNVLKDLRDAVKADSYTFKGVTAKGSVKLETPDGTALAISPVTFKNESIRASEMSSTEGGEKAGESTSPVNILQTGDTTHDARVVTTNNQKGKKNKPLDFVDPLAIEFERAPKDKRGAYGIEINTEAAALNSAWSNALAAVEKGDFSKIDSIIDNLPLNIKLGDNISAPLETRPQQGDMKVFEDTSRVLREGIVKELANGTDINDITIDITGQYNGQLQLDGQNNNNISHLFEFGGNVKNITLDKVFYADENKVLRNKPGKSRGFKTLTTRNDTSPGNLFLSITTAAGREFPLKLNVAKINENEADFLYDLVKYRADERVKATAAKTEDASNATPLSALPEILAKFNANFPNEVELFKKENINPEDLTVKEVLRFFAYDSNHPNAKFRFSKDKFLVGNQKFTAEQLAENKDEFISQTMATKRRHIKLKRTQSDTNNLNLSRRNYFEYLVNNTVLSTNAVINEPTFQGKTTMYINTASVKVKGELSAFNGVRQVKYNKNLVGTNAQLKKKFPKIFSKKFKEEPVTVDGESFYEDVKTGDLYPRVSSLKPKPPKSIPSMKYASQRGLLVDELLRQFFSTANLSKEKFGEFGLDTVISLNEKFPNQKITVTKEVVEAMYDIFLQYKDIFNKNNWTVYPLTTPLFGELQGKGKIAGSMDLLVYDNNNKKWLIVDLKTSSKDRAAIYGETKPLIPYKKLDSIQQNAYRELFKQLTGQDADLLILPITMEASNVKKDEFDAVPEMTSAKEKFLEVKKGDIYNLANINKGSFDKKAPKKTKSVKEDIETNREKAVSPVQTQKEYWEQYFHDDFYEVKHKDKSYLVTGPILNGDGQVIGGFHIGAPSSAAKRSELLSVSNDLRVALVEAATKQHKVTKNFTKENAEKIWNSQKNSVPLQKKKVEPKKKATKKKQTKPKTSTSNMSIQDIIDTASDEEANRIKQAILYFGRESDAGFIVGAMNAWNEAFANLENVTPTDELQIIYDFALEYGLDKTKLEKKCFS